MINKICDTKDTILKRKPLIHCITNPISINCCANTILCVGARPIMAEHPDEVVEITRGASALMMNIGNITDIRMKSIRLSFDVALKNQIPTMLDCVGVSCSKLRREYITDLIYKKYPSVIKGNYSEILALYDENYSSSGVDAEECIDRYYIMKISKILASRYNTTIIATGKTDIVSNSETQILINNGTIKLSTVTGTGCMLGALCSSFLAASNPFDAAVSSCVYFGIAGELSQSSRGNGSFMINLMDNLSIIEKNVIEKYINIEK